ncbi:hypothetical protein EGR_08525 [Echinococcus granulosus]|uniref:Uncharacterized protein n=1 Tax=Echinococcus granulosus TaxID=6210 RepID=W6UT94_ECHGR|nr:hypothetical protein EGR_08525 [Echinococcus granulosus]EUB56614.1 hypothetical protein EGR_08525 [Echinococcus granulosus]
MDMRDSLHFAPSSIWFLSRWELQIQWDRQQRSITMWSKISVVREFDDWRWWFVDGSHYNTDCVAMADLKVDRGKRRQRRLNLCPDARDSHSTLDRDRSCAPMRRLCSLSITVYNAPE